MKSHDNLNHLKNTNRAIRLHLIRNRQIKIRQRIKSGTARTSLSGFFLGLISLAIVISMALVSLWVAAILKDLPDIGLLEKVAGPDGQLYQPALFYDRTGQILISGNGGGDSVSVYSDPLRAGGDSVPALFLEYMKYLVGRVGVEQTTGSSIYHGRDWTMTIPDRLVSDFLIPNEPLSNIRTFRLRLLAAQAKARYGEDQLINWYLNSLKYRGNVRGVGAASVYYFNKMLEQINPGEMLILSVVSLTPAVNPIDTPDAFDVSLQKTISHLTNLGVIDETIVKQAGIARESIKAQSDDPDNRVPAFLASAKEQLIKNAGNNYPDPGSLRVITSLDATLQSRLECAIYEIFNDPLQQENCAGVLSGLTTIPLPEITSSDNLVINFVVLDPANGQVLAMFGDYTTAGGEQSSLNPHSAASLVTPFIYLTGLLQGMTPATMVWDTPTGLEKSVLENYPDDYIFPGPMSLRTALSGDHLAPATKLLAGNGMDNVIDLMSSFGLQLYASEGIPYTSGIADSLSIAQAYGIFANMGIRAGSSSQSQEGGPTPSLILRALDDNDSIVLDNLEHQEQTLVSPALAFLENDMLISTGEGIQKLRGSTKTSLNREGTDYWRVAYTPDYVIVVYLGYSEPAGKTDLSGLGIDTALVRVVEKTLLSDSSIDNRVIPEGITRQEFCVPSGMLPGEACPQTNMEYFLAGTEPTEIDSLYREYLIDTETGRLATVFTNPAKTTRKIFFNPPPEEFAWAQAAGYSLPPEDYEVFQSNDASNSTKIIEPINFASVKGLVTVNGHIEPSGFSLYRLDLGTGLAPTQWLQVGTSMTDLPQGNRLATLDTTKYANGLYTIRIQVLRQGNLADNSYVVIRIDNPTDKP